MADLLIFGKRFKHKDSNFIYWAIPCKMQFEPDYKVRMVCESHPNLDMKFKEDFLQFFEEIPQQAFQESSLITIK